jgi:hypothetical protein
VRVEENPDRRRLRIINRFENREHAGLLVVDDPETILPKVLAVLSERVPISVEVAGELDLPD